MTSTVISALRNDRSASDVKFAFNEINEYYVKSNLAKLKTNKAIGLDNISARLLKRLH